MTISQLLEKVGKLAYLPAYFTPAGASDSLPITGACHGDETGKDCLAAVLRLFDNGEALSMTEIAQATEATRAANLPLEVDCSIERKTRLQHFCTQDVENVEIHNDGDEKDWWIELF